MQATWLATCLFFFLLLAQSKASLAFRRASLQSKPPTQYPLPGDNTNKKPQPVQNLTLLLAGDFSANADGVELAGLAYWNSITGWTPFFNAPVSIGAINDMVNTNEIIYFGGKFRSIGEISSSSIVGYTPANNNWLSICGGVLGEVTWIEVSASRLYIGGDFDQVLDCNGIPRAANNIAMFDTQTKSWTTFGPGIPYAQIKSIAVQNGPTAQDEVLYVAGRSFSSPNSPSQDFVQMWNNGSFVELPNTASPQNTYTVVAIDQKTKTLYLGGRFERIGSSEVLNSIAKFVDNEWQPLNGGVSLIFPQVYAIAFYNDTIFVGGEFPTAGQTGLRVNNIAYFKDGEWFPLGPVTAPGVIKSQTERDMCLPNPSSVLDMTVIGDCLLINGIFDTASNVSVNNVALYNITSNIFMRVGDDSALKNTALIANGILNNDYWVSGIAQKIEEYDTYDIHQAVVFKYDSKTRQWTDLSTASIAGVGRFQNVALNGSIVYVAGSFARASGENIFNVAYFEEGVWHALEPNGLDNNGYVVSLAIDGDDLWIGGFFNSTARGPGYKGPMISLARWNKASKQWVDIDGGLMTDTSCSYNSTVSHIYVTHDFVYVGGSFPGVGQTTLVQSPNIAKWDRAGHQWMPVATGIPTAESYVRAMDWYAGELYVAGKFQFSVGSTQIDNIARYNPLADVWDVTYTGVQLATSSTGDTDGWINCILVTDDEITIGGHFYLAGGNIVHNIARYAKSKQVWSSYGGGLTSTDDLAEIHDIALDNSTGDIYACGSFTEADGSLLLNNIAKWANRTSSWTRVASSDLSRPEGILYKLFLVTNSIDDNKGGGLSFWDQYKVAGVAVSIVVAMISIILFVAFLIWKIKNRNPYEDYKPIITPISLNELEDDKDIKRIDLNLLELGERIAIGASGEVVRGTYQGREVAIKRTLIQASERQTHDFLREIKIMSLLHHKNIVEFIGAATTSRNQILLAMEFMANGSLKDHIQSSKEIDFNLKIRLCLDAARGMEYLHNWNPRIIHRDLKSSNLLITKLWNGKIGDFGISRFNNTISSTTLVGTPAYMAPEVIVENKFSTAADIYSFGIVLTEAISWKEPFADMSLSFQQVMFGVVQNGLRPSIPSSCPQVLAILIRECVDQQPEMRPDFKEIKKRLKRIL